MNRKETISSSANVKYHCANYNTGYICSGILIDERLNQWIDDEKVNKKCLIKCGKKCDYYTNIVEPILK